MTQTNKFKIVLLILMITLIFLQPVFAIGIQPAKSTVISEESKYYEGEFFVINNEERTFNMDVYVEGDLGKFVKLQTTRLQFTEKDKNLPVKYEIDLPDEIPPGVSEIKIVMEEVLIDNNPNVVSSKLILKHKVSIQGEYPNKYVVVKLNFHESEEKFDFISEVENLGKEDISEVKTKFLVNDKDENLRIVETNSEPLKTKENKLLNAKFEKRYLKQGEFLVSSVTEYDGFEVQLQKTLLYGKPEVEVTYFDKYFIANKINKYSMDLLNKWNKEIKNVYVDVNINKEGQKIDEFRTKSIDIKGEVTERINDYFDGKDKDPGSYSFDMIVNFWNLYKMDSKTFHTEFLTEEDFNKLGINFSFGNLLPWILFSMMLLIMSSYVGWRYIHREKYEGGERWK